jgi:hypothetical protein
MKRSPVSDADVFDRAARRVQWSALALTAAATELDALGDAGAVVLAADALHGVADACLGLAPLLAADRDLLVSGRRVRDGL